MVIHKCLDLECELFVMNKKMLSTKVWELPRHMCRNIYQKEYIMCMFDWWSSSLYIAAQYYGKLERVYWITFTIFTWLVKLQGSFKCPLRSWTLTLKSVVFVFFLTTYARNRQNNKNWWGDKWWKYMHDRQTTRNNFVDEEKNKILSASTTKVCAGLHEIFCFPLVKSHLFSFVLMS